MLTFDHLVIAAETLEEGVGHVQERLGVDIPFGGKHPLMGTHNHLMQLGPEAFLEVIAIDPEAQASRPRWYALDDFAGPPRLIHWVARVEAMSDAARLGVDLGEALDVSRGDLHWQLTVPQDGSMPYGGAFPSIIDWPEGMFPAPKMADMGCFLEQLVVSHPDHSEISSVLAEHLDDERIAVEGGAFAMKAAIKTPFGTRWL